MVFYCAVILALVIKHAATTLVGQESAWPLNVGDLAELIQKVAEQVKGNKKSMDRLDLDYFSTDDTHRAVLGSIMKLLEKNHLPQTQEDPEDLGVRIHVIKNPHVIEEYKKSLRRRRPHYHKHRVSTTTTPNPWEQDSGEPLSDLSSLARNEYPADDENEGAFRRKNVMRRNAVFRLDDRDDVKHSSEYQDKKGPQTGNISSENEKVIHFETKGESKKRKEENNKLSNHKEHKDNDQHDQAKKGKDNKEWDMITKKWDTIDRRDDKWGEKRQRASDEDWREEKPKRKKPMWSKSKSGENTGRWEEDRRDVAKAKSIRESFMDEKPDKVEHKVMKVDWKIKNDYKTDTTYGIPTYRTTKDKGNRGASKKKYVPKNPDFYQPQKQRSRDNGGNVYSKAFGRTSIPFVGKKGIYEE